MCIRKCDSSRGREQWSHLHGVQSRDLDRLFSQILPAACINRLGRTITRRHVHISLSDDGLSARFRGIARYRESRLLSNREIVGRPATACSDTTKFIALGEEQVSRAKRGKVRIPASGAFTSYNVRAITGQRRIKFIRRYLRDRSAALSSVSVTTSLEI